MGHQPVMALAASRMLQTAAGMALVAAAGGECGEDDREGASEQALAPACCAGSLREARTQPFEVLERERYGCHASILTSNTPGV